MEAVRRFLHETLVNIDDYSFAGLTPLMESIVSRKPEISTYLLQEGANVFLCDEYRQTALHYAVELGCNATAKELIERGANINATDIWGDTPLHVAVSKNNYEAVCMLLYYNAEANALNKSLYTPFMTSVCVKEAKDIQEVLLLYEEDVDRLSIGGNNALLLALEAESEIAVELFKRGCDVNRIRDYNNTLALALSNDFFHPYIEELFSKFNYNNLMDSKSYPILFILFGARIERVRWYEILELFVYSKTKGQKIVLHCADYYEEVFLTRLLNELHIRQISQDKILPILATCLTYGVKIYVSDIWWAYRYFGNGDVLQILLEHNIILNKTSYTTWPVLIADIKNAPSSHLDQYIGMLYYNYLHIKVEDIMHSLKVLLKFCTPPLSFRRALEGFIFSWKYKYKDIEEEKRKIDLCEELLNIIRSMPVPTLRELSRDAGRACIYSYVGKTEKTSLFYAIIKCANLPEIVKKIMCFQYTFNDVYVSS